MTGAQKIQPLVQRLMETLLENCPTLLDERGRQQLMDREFCKQSLGLSIGNHPLLKRAGHGTAIRGHNRYWKRRYGDFHVCSQWWKDDHISNAQALLNFVEHLTEQKAKHPDVAKLQTHRGAFEGYLQSVGRTPPPTEAFLLNMSKEMALWSEFLAVWPPARVREMSLEDYTNLNRDDAFVYWLEKRTEALGSIWGGSAFKFGIYRRNETSSRPEKGERIWGEEYAWMS